LGGDLDGLDDLAPPADGAAEEGGAAAAPFFLPPDEAEAAEEALPVPVPPASLARTPEYRSSSS
jgi:hypothetical protein